MRNEQGFMNVNGASLCYQVSGEGFPLVLIHAGIADQRMWDRQVEEFSKHFRVLRYDMRGFGQSKLPGGKFSNERDLAGLMDQLDIPKAHIAGISYGGLVAIEFALAFPERVSKMILGAPSVAGEEPSERLIEFWESEDAALESGDLEQATELNLRLWVDGPSRVPEQIDPWVRNLVKDMQLNIFKIPVPDDVDILPSGLPGIDRIPEISPETLILVGELDLDEKLEIAERLSEEMPSARRQIIPGTAHMLNMEKPEIFNELVLEFLHND